jgi:hypothetical protein
MKKHFGSILAAALCLIVTNGCLASDVLFHKVSRDYDQRGVLGKTYRREFETRMFTQPTWHQRLYYESHDPDVNETFEIYSRPDGSRWLSHRRASPSLSRIIWNRIFNGERFDLTKELNTARITGREVALPSELAKELELLWKTMLPGLAEAPIPRDLYVHTPIFIGFVRENNSVKTGSVSIASYNTPIYRAFVDIITDLRTIADRNSDSSESILAGLPSKVRSVRIRLQVKGRS